MSSKSTDLFGEYIPFDKSSANYTALEKPNSFSDVTDVTSNQAVNRSATSSSHIWPDDDNCLNMYGACADIAGTYRQTCLTPNNTDARPPANRPSCTEVVEVNHNPPRSYAEVVAGNNRVRNAAQINKFPIPPPTTAPADSTNSITMSYSIGNRANAMPMPPLNSIQMPIVNPSQVPMVQVPRMGNKRSYGWGRYDRWGNPIRSANDIEFVFYQVDYNREPRLLNDRGYVWGRYDRWGNPVRSANDIEFMFYQVEYNRNPAAGRVPRHAPEAAPAGNPDSRNNPAEPPNHSGNGNSRDHQQQN